MPYLFAHSWVFTFYCFCT
jgi:hypothetical protein